MFSILKKAAAAAVENTTGVSTTEMASQVADTVESLRTVKSLPLKVKILNLAAEARIIRTEEERELKHARKYADKFGKDAWPNPHKREYHSLKDHRETVVREEARDTLLAYGFLRGRSYSQIEPRRYSVANTDNVLRMILKYGRNVGTFKTASIREQALRQAFAQWLDEAPQVSVRGPRKPRIRPSKKADQFVKGAKPVGVLPG
jgi:hypothetical protein